MPTMTRTDVHRPSAPEFDPGNYEYQACGDNHPEDGYRPIQEIKELRAQGYRFIPTANNTHCTHCGAHLRYFALMSHEPTKTLLYIGEQCLDNRFSGTKAQFAQMREDGKNHKAARELATRRNAFIDANVWLQEVLDWDDYTNDFMSSLSRQLLTKGELSERQMQAARKCLDGQKRYQDRKAQEAAEKAAAVAAGTVKPFPITEDRVQVTGVVKSQKYQENRYGGCMKMLVEAGEGWKVWMTVPSSINPKDGDTVRFMARLEASKDDQFFGYASKPTKAVVL